MTNEVLNKINALRGPIGEADLCKNIFRLEEGGQKRCGFVCSNWKDERKWE